MASILKARRVRNSSRIRRNKARKKMTAKQIKFFGTKAQRAALKKRRSNSGRSRRRRNFPGGSRIKSWSKGRSSKTISITRHRNPKRKRSARRRNVGEILTASLSGLNPGKVKRMARRKRTRKVSNRRRRAMRNHSSRRPKTVIRYRSRRRNKVHGRRRNPGGSFLGGKVGQVVGVLGGAAVTSLLSANFIPASINTGITGYVASGVVAFLQGKLVGKVMKSQALGNDMVIGGLAYVVLRVINDMLPSVAGYLPFKLNGLGLIAPSSFYTPQVNMPGSMSSFVTPSAIPVMAAASSMHGLGATRGRRVGRMGY